MKRKEKREKSKGKREKRKGKREKRKEKRERERMMVFQYISFHKYLEKDKTEQ
jgi:hypothetical protein